MKPPRWHAAALPADTQTGGRARNSCGRTRCRDRPGAYADVVHPHPPWYTEYSMRRQARLWWLALLTLGTAAGLAPSVRADDKEPAYYPAPESRGGWRSLVPDQGAPAAAQKEDLRNRGGVDSDRLQAAWEFNRAADGASALIVIRHGYVVGEWYKDCDRTRMFNIYSSSKAYTSTAFGMLLGDSEAGRLPGGRKLTLDTKVCTAEWLPEALPLS